MEPEIYRFNLTDDEKEYLINELSDFVRGYIFLKAEKPAKKCVELISSQFEFTENDQITMNYNITIDIEMIIGLLGKRLPKPPGFDKKLLDQISTTENIICTSHGCQILENEGDKEYEI